MAKPKGNHKASGVKISFGKRKKVKGKKKRKLHANKSASLHKSPLIGTKQRQPKSNG